MAAPVEHHWNGQWGWARLDVYLERDGDRWKVRALQWLGRHGNDEWANLGEARARWYVQRLLDTAPGPPEGWKWRDISGTNRQYD
jgi:hypothetical protein